MISIPPEFVPIYQKQKFLTIFRGFFVLNKLIGNLLITPPSSPNEKKVEKEFKDDVIYQQYNKKSNFIYFFWLFLG
jgi:hypothetical protein